MTERIRWGICGTGSIAGQFAASLADIDDAELVAVASNDATRGAAFAGRFGAERTHLGYDAMADDGDVDVVYVASTQDAHLADVLMLVEGGRNVLCEKPFALSRSQAQTMIDMALANDVFLMEAMWSRFLPSYERLVELLDEGAIGDVRLVEANFSMRIADDDIDGHRLFDPARGGGALLDLGVYPVQLAHLVAGPPSEVHARATLTEDGVDEQTVLSLEHPGGVHSLLHTAIRTRGTCAARITGSEGVITLDPFMHCTTKLTVERGFEREELDFGDPSLGYQVPEVHRCVREGLVESPRMSHATTLEIMAILDEARSQIGVVFPGE